MDKPIEEEPIIRQQINAKISTLLAHPTRNEIVRAPLEVYKFCKSIFKRQAEVQKFLFQLFVREFHLKDPKKMVKETEEKKTDEIAPYLQVLLACRDAVNQ